MSPGTLVMLTMAGLTLPVLLPGQQTPATPVGQVQNLAHGAQWRITHGSIAGTALDFGLIEYVGVPRAKAAPAAADPGSPAVTMVVQDIDAAVDRWKKAGGTVVSTGGKAVKLPNGAGNVFLRDINGLLWEFSVQEVLR